MFGMRCRNATASWLQASKVLLCAVLPAGDEGDSSQKLRDAFVPRVQLARCLLRERPANDPYLQRMQPAKSPRQIQAEAKKAEADSNVPCVRRGVCKTKEDVEVLLASVPKQGADQFLHLP